MMIMKTLAAGVLAIAAATASVPAQAGDDFSVRIQVGQPWYHDGPQWGHKPVYHHTLSPQQVRRILRNRGYHDIRFVDRRGSIYRARAERNGRDFRLVVNAYTGHIIDRDRI